MSKIFKLFIDENIKTWKKFSTKLALVIIILSLVGVLALVKIIEKLDESYSSGVSYYEYDFKEDLQSQIDFYKNMLNEEGLTQSEKKDIQIQIERCEMFIKYNINQYYDYWKRDLVYEITELKSQDNSEKEIAKLIDILDKDDFKQYIELEKESAKKDLDDKRISQKEYDDKILILDLQGKNEIGKTLESSYWKRLVLSKIKLLQQSLRTGIDYSTGKILTVEKKQEYEDKIKLYVYRIENDACPIEYVENVNREMFEVMASMFVTSVIAIFAMIIAGGAISSEKSTGTIKFWALTPNKRWKILTAKILSLMFYIILITLLMAILTAVASNTFFETEGINYLYIKDGNVEKIENTTFIIQYYFAKIIPVVIFAIFALMLSVVTQNTAVAVSLSVATYMGNSIAMAIINTFVKKDWVKFIPFNNLNIADKIFPYFENPIQIFSTGSSNTTSLQFSVIVLAVCAILMLVTAYDSFNNRDII